MMGSDNRTTTPFLEEDIDRLLKSVRIRGIVFWILFVFIMIATAFLAKEPLYFFNFLESDPSIPLSGQIFRILFYFVFLVASAFMFWFTITYIFIKKRATISDEQEKGAFRKRYAWFDVLTVIPLFLAFIIVVNGFFFGFAYVSGSSMEPSYSDGDFVVIDHYSGSYADDDVVIIQLTDEKVIKRLIAVPGDTIMIDETGIYVNGQSIETNTRGALMPETVVSANECYVLGDNREGNNSQDSRSYGFVAMDKILGKVIYPDRELEE